MKRACWVLSANAMERFRRFDVSSEDSDGALEETEISSHESEDDRVGPTPAPIPRDRSASKQICSTPASARKRTSPEKELARSHRRISRREIGNQGWRSILWILSRMAE